MNEVANMNVINNPTYKITDFSALAINQKENTMISNYGRGNCRGFSALKLKDFSEQLNNKDHIPFNTDESTYKCVSQDIKEIVASDNDILPDFKIENSQNIITPANNKDLSRTLSGVIKTMDRGEVRMGNFSVDGHAMAIKIERPIGDSKTACITLYDPDRQPKNPKENGTLVNGVTKEVKLDRFGAPIDINSEVESLISDACVTAHQNKLSSPKNSIMMNLFSYTRNPKNSYRYEQRNLSIASISKNFTNKNADQGNIKIYGKEMEKYLYSDVSARLLRKGDMSDSVKLFKIGLESFKKLKESDPASYLNHHAEVLSSLINIRKEYNKAIKSNMTSTNDRHEMVNLIKSIDEFYENYKAQVINGHKNDSEMSQKSVNVEFRKYEEKTGLHNEQLE
jgi:hypothetical protein